MLFKLLLLSPFFLLTIWLLIQDIQGNAVSWVLEGWSPGLVIISLIGIFHLLYMSPTFFLHDEGITVSFVFRKIFVRWDNVLLIRKGTVQNFIVFRKLTLVNYLAGWIIGQLHPAITFSKRRKNYDIVMKFLMSKIPEKIA